MVLVGALIMESLRPGTILAGIDLRIRRISRSTVSGTTPQQPPIWTLVEFTSDTDRPDRLAAQLADVLDSPGWYASFEQNDRVFVIFPGRVLQHDRHDERARADIIRYALAAGVPESQCDW